LLFPPDSIFLVLRLPFVSYPVFHICQLYILVPVYMNRAKPTPRPAMVTRPPALERRAPAPGPAAPATGVAEALELAPADLEAVAEAPAALEAVAEEPALAVAEEPALAVLDAAALLVALPLAEAVSLPALPALPLRGRISRSARRAAGGWYCCLEEGRGQLICLRWHLSGRWRRGELT
jgi:hypothetical protein